MDIDQNFFVQNEISHSVILGQLFITALWMETKVLDSGADFARIQSQSGGKTVQFLTVPSNHERNKRELLSQTKMDFSSGLLRSGELIVSEALLPQIGRKISTRNKCESVRMGHLHTWP